MKREMLIHRWQGKLMGALIEDGHLVEYWHQGEAEVSGQIYKGRIERVVPGMKAAFVDIGQEKNGFLPLDEGNGPLPLQSGQEILVQIKKAAQGTKGAFLSREITLPGQYVLYLPLTAKVGVSKRVTDEAQRSQLFKLGHQLACANSGLVMRANALEASLDDIEEELCRQKTQWEAILKAAGQVNAPAMLSSSSTHAHRLLNDYAGHIDQLVCDEQEVVEAFKELVSCRQYQGETDLFMLYNVPKQLDQALWPKVWLKSGGYLVINPCEALTVIDVNTGKFTGKKLLEETLFKLNLEACETIARQVRLRGLAGILIIDFIDMQSEEHRAKVVQALSEAFAQDRQKTVLHGLTSLGLMEMTRKKDQPPLHQWLMTPCKHCQGTGYLKGVDETNA